MRPAPRCARRRRAPGAPAGTPRRLRCPVGAGGSRWPRWSATGPAAAPGSSTESECPAAAAGSGAASCEDDYAALIAAAHAQLTAPIILVWDNLNVHRSAAMRRFCDAHADWLTVVQLPAYAPELNATEGVWAHVKRGLGNLLAVSVAELSAVTVQLVVGIQTLPLVSWVRTSKGRRPCLAGGGQVGAHRGEVLSAGEGAHAPGHLLLDLHH